MEHIVLPDVSRLSFDSKKHAYKLDGDKLLSGVTTVLSATSDKQNLINWAANEAVDYIEKNSEPHEYGDAVVPDAYTVSDKILHEARTAHTRKKEAAGDKGTDMHAMVEDWINATIAGQTKIVENEALRPFIDWVDAEVGHFLVAEQKLYDDEFMVAGTADFFYVSKVGELCTGDLKTFPKMWSPDAYCQTGIYSRMFHRLTGSEPTKSVIVKMCDPSDPRLQKYGTKPFAVYPRFSVKEDAEMFLKRLEVHRYNQNFKSPNE